METTTIESGCCPTCGRPYARAKRAAATLTQREQYDQSAKSAEARAALSDAELIAYCEQWGTVEDLLFVREKAGAELVARIDALLDQPKRIPKRDVYPIFDARRRELAAFWRHHADASAGEIIHFNEREYLHRR